MGAVISRRRRRQAKSRSTSTQATEWSIGESLAAECKEAVSTDAALYAATRKATVRSLRIGDGLTSSQVTCSRKSQVKKRTNIGNRKTKVLSKVKFKYRWLHKKEKTRGTDCSTQFDHVALAREVTPNGQSPNAYQCALEEGNGTLNITLSGGEPAACDFDQPTTATDQRTASQETKSTSEAELAQGEMMPVWKQMTANQEEQDTVIDEYSTEDENSNILERSRIEIFDRADFLPVPQNSDQSVNQALPAVDIGSDKKNSDGDRSPVVADQHSKVINRDECQPVADLGSPPMAQGQCSGQGDTISSIPPQTTADSKPAAHSTSLTITDLKSDSSPSFEDYSPHAATGVTRPVFNESENASDLKSTSDGERLSGVELTDDGKSDREIGDQVICSGQPTDDGKSEREVGEQVACSGQDLTHSSEHLQQTVPSPTLRRADVMAASAATGTDPTEQTLPPPPGCHASWDETPLECEQEDLSLENDSCTGDDISEDTLDWNVDDRVRSPSDSRSVGTAPSDDDENNIDNLNDCTTMGMATSVCQLQTSLCRLKNGDSTCKMSSGDNVPQDLETEEATDADGQNQTQNGENSTIPTTLTNAETKDSEKGMNEMEANNDTFQSQSHTATENEYNGSSQHENTVENRQNVGDNDGTPNDVEKSSIDETGRILVGLAGENMTPDDDMKATKSVVEKQEVEAITLLLLTGLLPDEPSSGIIRGAGDAQNLESVTERERSSVAQDSNETAGLACMTDSLSKSSCQLEQLQTDGNPVQNLTAGSNAPQNDVQPPSTEQVSSNNSSAAGVQATDHQEDSVANNFTQSQADSSEADNTLTDLSVSCFGTMHGAAAASFVEERVEPSLPSPQRTISPGAASSESEWEVIPLHRVLGQTNLGGLPACATLAPSQMVSELDGPSENSQLVPELQTISAQPFASKSQASETMASMTQSMDVEYVPQEGREWNFFNATPCEEQDAHSPLHLMTADTVAEAKEEQTEVPSAGTSVPQMREQRTCQRAAGPPLCLPVPISEQSDQSQNAIELSSNSSASSRKM